MKIPSKNGSYDRKSFKNNHKATKYNHVLRTKLLLKLVCGYSQVFVYLLRPLYSYLLCSYASRDHYHLFYNCKLYPLTLFLASLYYMTCLCTYNVESAEITIIKYSTRTAFDILLRCKNLEYNMSHRKTEIESQLPFFEYKSRIRVQQNS